MGQQPLSQIRNRTSAATCVYFTGGVLAPPHVDGLATSCQVDSGVTRRRSRRQHRGTSFAPQATIAFFHFREYSQASFVADSLAWPSWAGPRQLVIHSVAALCRHTPSCRIKEEMLPPDAINSLRCRPAPDLFTPSRDESGGLAGRAVPCRAPLALENTANCW
jgi:hypothetical protein